MKPESLMMSHGYKPELSQSRPNEELGLIYSCINNPNLEILEDACGYTCTL